MRAVDMQHIEAAPVLPGEAKEFPPKGHFMVPPPIDIEAVNPKSMTLFMWGQGKIANREKFDCMIAAS